MYGRLLMEAGEYEAAKAQYVAAMKLFTNRALAVLGFARAAHASGNAAAARGAAAAFTAMWSNADPGRPELAEAVAAR